MDTRRRLTLLRHAKAHAADGHTEDGERTLTKRGVQQAEEMARRLVARGLVPDLIVASPAARAWATAEIVARGCELPRRRLRAADELYLAEPDAIWRVAARCDADVRHLLICAHNPGLSRLASRFGPHPQTRELATAGLASAVWDAGDWRYIEPEDADRCEVDDPERDPEARPRRPQP